MPFKTKIDYSNNRQIRQTPEAFTILSGGTKFGVPFSALTAGPNLSTSGISQTYTNLVSTFSGNSGTTIFSWYNPNMALGAINLSALTPSNSATTQNTGNIFTGNTIGTTVDGNSVFLSYSGLSFDIVGLGMISLGGGNYSGTVHTNNLYYYTASTLDYTGRTIWVDVSGITRTNELIITKSPNIGYVWTCIDSEGKGGWSNVSGITNYWSSGSGLNSVKTINSLSNSSGAYSLAEGSGTTASGDYSHAEGFQTTASGIASHAEGYNTTASGDYSHASGHNSRAAQTYTFVYGNNSVANADNSIVLGSNITANTTDYTYVESLNIKTVGSSAFVNDIRIAANGFLTTNTSDIRLKKNIEPLVGSLDIIKKLNGVNYQWIDSEAGGTDFRIGFIAQDVELVEPKLVFTNKGDGFKGIHIDSIIPILVEAVKELSNTRIFSGESINTQKIIAEDNNIDLNYGGNSESAINGGIRVLEAFGENKAAELLLDKNGFWVTNNNFKPKSISIPRYTPSSSDDLNGLDGNIVIDDDFIYVKINNKWKRSNLEEF